MEILLPSSAVWLGMDDRTEESNWGFVDGDAINPPLIFRG